jgi:hypothetical protein
MSQFQGDDCGINDFQSSNNADTRFAVRQTGEEFRSEAPPDCRIVVCGTDGTIPATITTTVAPTPTTTIIAPTAAVPLITTTPVPTVAPITSATVPLIPTAVPTTVDITVPQTPTSAQVSDEPENPLIPFGIQDVMVLKPVELLEESILQPGQLTSDILNNIYDSDSDENENEIENDIDDIRITSEIAPIYVRPVLNQAFYNPTYYRDEK